jgi:hypothetical protein
VTGGRKEKRGNISQNSLPSCQRSKRVHSCTENQHKTKDHSHPINKIGVNTVPQSGARNEEYILRREYGREEVTGKNP